jgi:hypothetical protein
LNWTIPPFHRPYFIVARAWPVLSDGEEKPIFVRLYSLSFTMLFASVLFLTYLFRLSYIEVITLKGGKGWGGKDAGSTAGCYVFCLWTGFFFFSRALSTPLNRQSSQVLICFIFLSFDTLLLLGLLYLPPKKRAIVALYIYKYIMLYGLHTHILHREFL